MPINDINMKRLALNNSMIKKKDKFCLLDTWTLKG